MRWRMLAAVVVGLLWLGTPVSWAQPTPTPTPDLGMAPDIAAREARECTIPPDQPPITGRALWNANLWPGGIVPYEFDANVTAGNQAVMRQAMDVLEAAAYVRFVPRTGQPDALHIQNSNGNSSYVGTIGGVQPVNIFNWNFRYIMCHELMHALGIWHEQSRADRGTFVSIDLGNVCQSCCGGGSCNHNFNIVASAAPEGMYDFDSVMHYSATAFSTNGQPTIVAQPAYAQYQSLMGQRTHLSTGDIAGLVSRYGHPTPHTWTLRASSSPGERADPVMAYDSDRGVTVLFGGYAFNGTDFDTWEWDGINWTKPNVTGLIPVSRMNLSMAYDSVRNVTVLVDGGYGETWEYDGSEWTRRMVAGPSIPYSEMVFDATRGVMVLYGCACFEGADVGETWEWDGIEWRLRSTTGPAARTNHAMAYDSTRGVTVLFGGIAEGWYAGDTWEWDGTVWTQRSATGPIPRYDHTMAYDSVRGVTVLYGGTTPGESRYDTWEWDGSAWNLRLTSGTNASALGAMIFDAARGEVVFFGGYGQSGEFFGETWAYDGIAWTIRGGPSPSPRQNHAMAFDAARGTTVLFGGYSRETGAILNDTWTWNGSIWHHHYVPGPDPRYSHAMAYDAARGVTVLYGGYSNDATNNETWEWDGTAWTQRMITGSQPPPLRNHAMAYDAERGVVVLFGGYTGSAFSESTWEWDGTSWTNRVTPLAPSARYYHAMAYDSLRQMTILFGGGTNAIPRRDTWGWNGSQWSLLATSGPEWRLAHAMAFDSVSGSIVLFGGEDSGLLRGDTWLWDGQGWEETPSGALTPRQQHAMAYDSIRGVPVLFGGSDGFVNNDEIWELIGPCTSPLIIDQPDAQRIYAAGTAIFEVGATGSNPRDYQWSVRPAGFGSWVPLVNGNNPGIGVVQGANAALVMVTVAPELPTGTEFRCTVTNDCSPGTITSTAATLSVCLCPADFNCDGAVDFFDYDDFVVAFESGDPRADFDADGTVDFFDYDAFVVAFEVVC